MEKESNSAGQNRKAFDRRSNQLLVEFSGGRRRLVSNELGSSSLAFMLFDEESRDLVMSAGRELAQWLQVPVERARSPLSSVFSRLLKRILPKTIHKSKWYPQEGVTCHAGSPISPNTEFFVPPPSEIGKIISADSTLTVSQQPIPLNLRILFISLGVSSTVALACLLLLTFGFEIGLVQYGIIAVAAVIAGGYIYLKSQFAHLCSYVGERGIVKFNLLGSRTNQATASKLDFRDAEYLFTSQTRQYKNGIYVGTTYRYKWLKKDGSAFRLTGEYRSQRGWPPEKDPWHFANSAEASWSNYRWRTLNALLEKQGYVEFAMFGNPRAVRIGSGFLEFVLRDGSTQRAEVSDMKDVSLKEGIFKFVHKDARWWSGKWKYSFTYADLPNAKLFLLCLERLAGFSCSW